MTKRNKTKRLLKIIGGVVIFFTLPTLLFFGFMYLKYNEDLPTGTKGPKADQLAKQMLKALDYEAYKKTDYLEWTFKGNHHYKWHKSKKLCEVRWNHFRVELDLDNSSNSKIYVAEQEYNGVEKQDYINKAIQFFNNDSFWLVAPYKVFDDGTERSVIQTEGNKEALLVTYTSGGKTPGDSYLWNLDENYKPVSYKMWVDIIPIDGIEATWEGWITTQSGAQLPTFHKILVFGLEINGIKGL